MAGLSDVAKCPPCELSDAGSTPEDENERSCVEVILRSHSELLCACTNAVMECADLV